MAERRTKEKAPSLPPFLLLPPRTGRVRGEEGKKEGGVESLCRSGASFLSPLLANGESGRGGRMRLLARSASLWSVREKQQEKEAAATSEGEEKDGDEAQRRSVGRSVRSSNHPAILEGGQTSSAVARGGCSSGERTGRGSSNRGGREGGPFGGNTVVGNGGRRDPLGREGEEEEVLLPSANSDLSDFFYSSSSSSRPPRIERGERRKYSSRLTRSLPDNNCLVLCS